MTDDSLDEATDEAVECAADGPAGSADGPAESADEAVERAAGVAVPIDETNAHDPVAHESDEIGETVDGGWISTGWGGFESPFRSTGAVPDFRAARRHVLGEVIRFANRLRTEGVSVPSTGALDATRALSVVGLSDRERVAHALRTTLIVDEANLQVFEERFPTFWRRLRLGIDEIAASSPATNERDDVDGTVTIDLDTLADPVVDDEDEESFDDEDGDADDRGSETRPDAPDEVPRIRTERRHATGDRPTDGGEKDARRFSTSADRICIETPSAVLTDREIGAIDRFTDVISTLSGRRNRPAGQAGQVDARRALRAALETGGTPMELPRREPVESERRVCLLLDVSGSVLDTIDRATLLAFAEGLHERSRHGRVFFFDDEFADVTEQFDRAAGDPAAALREAEVHWGGGTRIGAALETVRTRHPDAVDRRTIVVVVSDGLDVGDDESLRTGITWLAGRAEAIVWLNPLAVSESYEPETRGMRTCLPYVDALFGFASPADLAEAVSQLERRGIDGSVGYEHDSRFADRARAGETCVRRARDTTSEGHDVRGTR